jgi:hypothetical protein
LPLKKCESLLKEGNGKDMNFREYLACFSLGMLTPSEFVDMANTALDENFITDEFCALACENSDTIVTEEVSKEIMKAISKIGVELPTLEQAAKIYVCYCSQQIIEGLVSPYKGTQEIRLMYRQIENRITDDVYAGDRVGISEFLSLYFMYDDVDCVIDEEEKRWKYKDGPLMNKKEALKKLDMLVIEAAKNFRKNYGT